MIVEVEREERYWYPDDGGIVWLAGFQLVAPDGRYLGRDAPELAAAGLRIAGVAAAGARAGHGPRRAVLRRGAARAARLPTRPAHRDHDAAGRRPHHRAPPQRGLTPRDAEMKQRRKAV